MQLPLQAALGWGLLLMLLGGSLFFIILPFLIVHFTRVARQQAINRDEVSKKWSWLKFLGIGIIKAILIVAIAAGAIALFTVTFFTGSINLCLSKNT